MVIAGLAVLLTVSVTAASAAPLEGVWVGGGHARPTSGKRERLRCRITYSRMSSKIYNVVAICATTAAKIRQTGELVKVRPGLYVGDFNNRDYDISGRVRVITKGRRQSVSFSSDAGKGSLSLRKR